MKEGRNRRLGANIRAFRNAAQGSTVMMFALALPVMLGAAGIAVDFATFSMKQSALQAAADAAALAGAKELSLANSKDSVIQASALAYLSAQLVGKNENAVGTATVDRTKGSVKVHAEEVWTPFFAQFIDAGITPISVSATASLAGSSNICVLALNPSSGKDLFMDSSSNLTANGCGVYSNSLHTTGLTVSMSASLKADLVCSAGGISKKGSITPAPLTDCPVVADPLASRPAPSVGACDYTDFSVSSGSHVLLPGVYCGGLKVTGTANATLSSGNYIITTGPLMVSDSATLQGSHVGFYLAGAAARIVFTGNTTISLTGPTVGELAGLLFFEDRKVPANRQHRIQSSNAQNLTGTIYLSRGYLLIDPSALVANKSAYTAIITDRLELASGPELVLNANYGATDVPVPEGIRASATVVLSN
jgi:Flp pilus assembly protein TadG